MNEGGGDDHGQHELRQAANCSSSTTHTANGSAKMTTTTTTTTMPMKVPAISIDKKNHNTNVQNIMKTNKPAQRRQQQHSQRLLPPPTHTVYILHSKQYTNILYENFHHIHKDRDILYSSLLYYYGFIKQRPAFLHLVRPKMATRDELEMYHDCDYLDLLQCYHYCYDDQEEVDEIIDSYGLIDDCPLPPTSYLRSKLWEYCSYVAGASIQAAELLLHDTNYNANVAINFGGGRHHAHHNKAGGFCYVNDVVLAIKCLLGEKEQLQQQDLKHNNDHCDDRRNHHDQMQQRRQSRRVIYLDLDIHHCDGVQSAFYDSDEVLTISLHRYTPGFFPSTTGSTKEKGKYQTPGVGYNLNVPMPRSCTNYDFIQMWKHILKQIIPSYDPDYVVVCVGADGLRDDDLVKDTFEGWNLTPEGIAYCVKLLALQCAGCPWDDYECHDDYDHQTAVDEKQPSHTNLSSCIIPSTSHSETSKKNLIMKSSKYNTLRKRKLLVLGGGGYNPSNTARTFLLCTAAACEGARPGILDELPKDIPKHEYFSRYGPAFELYSKDIFTQLSGHQQQLKRVGIERNDEYTKIMKEGIEAINLQAMFLWNRNKSIQEHNVVDNFYSQDTSEDFDDFLMNGKTTNGTKGHTHSRKRKKKNAYCTDNYDASIHKF